MTPTECLTADDLRPLIKRGLPISGDVISDRLLDLPGVSARATTRDRDSRVAAFNALLRQLLRRVADPAMAVAAGMLFGERATAGNTLTERRSGAAQSLGRDPDHFRKHIEPRILADLAAALAADSDRMTTTRATAPRLIPVLHPQTELPQDMWAWEASEHEEHISRLWSAVYALRAELLACERLSSFDPSSVELRDAADAALWRFGQLHVVIRIYRRAYGNRLLHGDIDPATLVGLAGWTAPMDPAELDAVCHHAPDAEPVAAYISDLTSSESGARIYGHWLHHLAIRRSTINEDAGSTT